ncbi:MAG: hypothetical protein WCO19_03065 [Candidatus Saccharibacteria bacterium]
MKKPYTFVLAFVAALSTLTMTNCNRVSALSQSLSTTISISAGCVSTINGSSGNASTSVVTGSEVSITILNSELSTGQTVSGPGIPEGSFLTRDGKETTLSPQKTFNLGVVSGPITLTFTPVPNAFSYSLGAGTFCPDGASPTSSSLTINTVDPPKQVANTPASPTPTTTQTKPTTSPPTATAKADKPKDTAQPVRTTQDEPELTAESDQAIDSRTPAYVWALGALILVAIVALIVASVTGKVPYKKLIKKTKPSRKK